MKKQYFTYILASRPRGSIYVGVTNDLARRVDEHRRGVAIAHTRKYRIRRLVHVEAFDDVEEAIRREKRLKRWRRAWKDELIETSNPDWRDISDRLG
ncbi:MAG: excinuclease ABC subunit C [Rhizobiales bacterium NRL2]|jgi:putative endonuclease|nr:MAG: excinuclease ABC subunit C [Rhizobiales bacterium NRL2]